ncbi:GNAT family N-acetyltransferase [Catellatospora sp. KI3]|uniref:GNAT family N-acetyltransferase n=1 Tax=Catellatospora sp. KI3 TaxID=3041620 RepID=UPI00248281C4|nr:GNAT family N-acetyltransferase [Catellatospora sp. KI3]MDI1465720.1 GNAT family N-acetyltransferase [Catellatospora sp. KI3]
MKETPVADVEVVEVPESSRYEARQDGVLLGELTYHRRPGMIVFDHTGVEPAARGRGIGALLVAAAMADAAADEVHVVPACSFVRRWVHDHPEYLPLIEHS